MFTGLVQDLGRVEWVEGADDGLRLWISSSLSPELSAGDSIAVNGVCLTATELDDSAFAADVMNETLSRAVPLFAGDAVNLELPLRASDRLGGHILQGHVDGIGEVVAVRDDGFARRVEVAAPAGVMRYVVEKGSIAVNGVSLTVAGIDNQWFTVSLIPETLERTNLGRVQVGMNVNLEVDVLAKYVEKLLEPRA